MNRDNAELAGIKQAHSEWVCAQRYFESVDNPELVDYAIYQLEASKRRYMYMLSRQKSREKTLVKKEDGLNLTPKCDNM